MTNTHTLARFITGLRFQELPNDVVEKVKGLSLNTWGVQLAASTLPWSKLFLRYMEAQGGSPQSTVVNYGIRTSSSNAAFVNSCFAHGFELDDNHGKARVKGGSVTVPTALAVGEAQLSSGEDFITAVVAGYEVMTRLSLATRELSGSMGNHPTGSTGAVGAAVVTAKLLNLDEATMVHVLGIAATHLVGYSEVPTDGRGHLKRAYGGMAAVGGIRAAYLAGAGLTGAETTLDSGYGFMRRFDVKEVDAGILTSDLGVSWKVLASHYKIFAQDGFIQPMTEGLERIRKQHSFATNDIDYVVLGTSRHAHDHVVGTIREPNDLTDAQFSASFSAALFLVKGGAGFHEYVEANLHDPEILDLNKRIVVEVDEEIDADYRLRRPRGAKVKVRLTSGEEFREHVVDLRTMQPSELDAKFRRLATTVLSAERSNTLLEAVHELESIRDVSQLATMLTRGN